MYSNTNPYEDAVKEGSIPKLEELLLQGVPCYVDLRTVAATHGKINILRWLQSRGHQFTCSQIDSAVSFRQRDTVRWLLEQDCPCTENTLTIAVNNNDTATVGILLHSKNELDFDQEMVNQAALRGHTEMLLLMSLQGAEEYIQNCADYAASGNQVKILEILSVIGVKFTIADMAAAAETGALDALKWLHSECKIDILDKAIIYRAAQKSDQQGVLTWFSEIGYVS